MSNILGEKMPRRNRTRRGRGRGWHGEPDRHRKARNGIKTGRKHYQPRPRYRFRPVYRPRISPDFERRIGARELGPIPQDGEFRASVDLDYNGFRLIGSVNLEPIGELSVTMLNIVQKLPILSNLKPQRISSAIQIAQNAIEIADILITRPDDPSTVSEISKRLINTGMCLVMPNPPDTNQSWLAWVQGSNEDKLRLILRIALFAATHGVATA
jgi:hypothetical protein